MSTFPIEIETLELGEETILTGFFAAQVATDADGTFFDLKEMTSDGKTVRAGDWRWAAMVEWIALQSLRKFSPLHDAMIQATAPDERAAAYVDHLRSLRAA